jgi:hypothetical protein
MAMIGCKASTFSLFQVIKLSGEALAVTAGLSSSTISQIIVMGSHSIFSVTTCKVVNEGLKNKYYSKTESNNVTQSGILAS